MAAIRWQFWLGLSFFTSVVMATLAGAIWLYYLAMDANQVPINKLVVQGELVYLERSDVRALLTGEPLGSFFSADVNEIRQRLEQMPWVEQASVRKEWPDVLQVFIVERQPLGYWNAKQRPNALVSTKGRVFEADVSRIEVLLPYFEGPENAVLETLEYYQQVHELLKINGHQVTALRLSERFSVEVDLLAGITLRLGREAIVERVQRFIDLFPQIVRQRATPIAYVDLRYDTGVAVGWKQPTEKQERE
ncbi:MULTISPECIES: cell division protein FtsQ/DivIB [Idiomarinaceae]|uniref:Cell division protein FtsQ n=1 Tax=Pseudidiomarina sp. PP-1MA TaxID=3237706 RepID=A0AB39XB22_9GAMM|nr:MULTISPECIES: cell division protein FtsQ/DivIB [Idiomarina]MDX1525751.1 FtsQ-type POTRA domain-containing protein [Pseudidiomarina maritima]